jgi:hypothetical protein
MSQTSPVAHGEIPVGLQPDDPPLEPPLVPPITAVLPLALPEELDDALPLPLTPPWLELE